MKQQIAPYINFQGRAREAMELYQSVLGGKLELYAAGEHGAPRPAEPGDRIQHARLRGDGFSLSAPTATRATHRPPATTWPLSSPAATAPPCRRRLEKLAEGGQVKMPLTDGPWGGAAAWLTDRFGVNWNLDLEQV